VLCRLWKTLNDHHLEEEVEDVEEEEGTKEEGKKERKQRVKAGNK
jgi:hypothetical protein